jgi:HPt (histidine-containing phosphotransfer) domain-containing protein
MAASTEKAGAAGGPVDVDHLKMVTSNDPKMEREVLTLFSQRAAASLIAIEQAQSRRERHDAAHRLVGGARAIGANGLAEAAKAIEMAETLNADDVAALSRAMTEVIRFLEARLKP